MNVGVKSWFGLCAGIALIILAIATARHLIPAAAKPVMMAEKALDAAAAAISSWSQNKVTISIRHETLGIKPINEFAFASLRIRVTDKWTGAGTLQDKFIISDQAFDLRFGWDQRDKIAVCVNDQAKTVTITAPEPHLLGQPNPVEDHPNILFFADGITNRITPDDMADTVGRLRQNARRSVDFRDARDAARNSMENFFRGMFALQGYRIAFNYSGSLDLPVRTTDPLR